MFDVNLGDGFILKEVSLDELGQVLDVHYARSFSNRANALANASLRPPSEKLKERRKGMNTYFLRMVLYKNSEVVGWHFGNSSDAETYYMKNSVVLKNFRQQGLYSRMLTAVLEILQQEGFEVVTSLHHPNNPAILIPKLKAGFVITGTQIHERFRFLIELRYYFDPNRRAVLNENIGLVDI
ncbi:MAG TPA: GNAT family N-acetyltransferase [Bdellovibrio sp.]|uniref:GNAT family N-acetyltransferase n=1 Tax=Bdellovibrio sp. TaxID=28201 RepID=UPI002F1229BE